MFCVEIVNCYYEDFHDRFSAAVSLFEVTATKKIKLTLKSKGSENVIYQKCVSSLSS